MGRPLKGTLKQLPSGRWQASLPHVRGKSPRSTPSFDDEQSAQRWIDAGLTALKADQPLPNPEAFRVATSAKRPEARRIRPSFSAICWKWHDTYYEQLRQAEPERMEQAGDYIGNHLVPYFASIPDVLDILDDPELGNDLVIAFMRHLAGFRLEPSESAAVGPALGMLTAKQAADHFGASVSTIDRRRRSGDLQVAGVDEAGANLYRDRDLRAVGLVREAGPSGLSKQHAQNILWTLKRIVEFACTRGWLHRDPTVGVKSIAPDPVRARKKAPTVTPREWTIAEVLGVARHMSVVHQLALLLLRLLGLRIGEAFGILVGNVIEMPDGRGLVVIEAQGGRLYKARDNDGNVVRTARVEHVKTATSYRVLAIPTSLMALIRVVIAAYHTNPTTGEVEDEARLIPGLKTRQSSGQSSFRTALGIALVAEQLDADVSGFAAGPHHLRKSLITDLSNVPALDDLVRRKFAGHAKGVDVHARHYILSSPNLAPLLAVAAEIERAVQDDVDTLIVPTTTLPQFGAKNELSERREFTALVLCEAGWQVDFSDDDETLCDTDRVAFELEIGVTTARRAMSSGTIPTIVVRQARGGRGQRMARLEDLQRLRREQTAPKVGMNELADELELSYHQAYHLVLSIRPDTGKDPLTGEYILDDELLAAARAEHERVRALHQRSMKAAEAAQSLGCAESTVYLRLRCGHLPLDPETDSSGAKFVPRDSVDAELKLQREVDDLSPEPRDHLSVTALAQVSGLNRIRINALVKAGHLETVGTDRARAVTVASIRRWAVGYRPDLLPQLPALE